MINIQKMYSQLSIWWRLHYVGGVPNIGKIGCTTTDLAMFLEIFGYNLTPPQVEEAMTKVGGYLYVRDQNGRLQPTGLIIWSKIEKAFPKVKFVYRYYSYNNSKVLSLIRRGLPVLVEVRHPSGIKHWVLFIGDQKAIDPLSGSIISTSKYPVLGFAEIVGR